MELVKIMNDTSISEAKDEADIVAFCSEKCQQLRSLMEKLRSTSSAGSAAKQVVLIAELE